MFGNAGINSDQMGFFLPVCFGGMAKNQHQNNCNITAKPVTANKRAMIKPSLKKTEGKSLPVPSLCSVQLVKSASDVYPQVLDSKLQEPCNSWLWAWMVALRKKMREGRK